MDNFVAHILVVDDDEGIRTLVKKYLNENNYLVTTANSAEDAFEKIQIGLPTDNSNLDEEVKELVAYHEAGHSLCSLYFENSFIEVKKRFLSYFIFIVF